MKVIFIKDLRGQGKINDIKEVSDGYATNFLIKNGYAVKYTKVSLEKLNNTISLEKAQEELNKKEATKLKSKIEKEKIVFIVKTGSNGKIFGTISSKQIHEELVKKGYNIDKRNIKIESPISSLGSHIVKIILFKDISGDLTVSLKEK